MKKLLTIILISISFTSHASDTTYTFKKQLPQTSITLTSGISANYAIAGLSVEQNINHTVISVGFIAPLTTKSVPAYFSGYAGYDFKVSAIYITPLIGAAYKKINDSKELDGWLPDYGLRLSLRVNGRPKKLYLFLQGNYIDRNLLYQLGFKASIK